MHMRSATTMTAVDLPLLILNYLDESVFVESPHALEELKAVAAETFEFGALKVSKFNLYTRTLDVCQGKRVRITAKTFPVLRDYLDVIEVVASAEGSESQISSPQTDSLPTQPQPSSALEKAHGTIISQSEELITAHRKASDLEHLLAYEIERCRALTRQVEQAAVQGRLGSASLDDVPGKRNRAHSIRDTLSALEAGSRGRSSNILDTITDESETEDESITPATTPRMTASLEQSLQDAANELTAKYETVPKLLITRASVDSLASLSSTTETSNSSSTSSGKKPARPKSPVIDYIDLPISHPETSQEAMIRTQLSHTVGKVLRGTCNNFGLDHKTSRLYRVVSVFKNAITSSGDNATFSQRSSLYEFQCDVHMTLAQSGITADSVLIVRGGNNDSAWAVLGVNEHLGVDGQPRSPGF